MKRVGILGGTFNPPHLGHLWIAEEVRIAMELEEIWFIPTYTPPHKDESKIDASDRLNMLDLAIRDNEYFKLNTIELERKGKSYTLQTIKELKMKYSDHEFCFIIGADMVEYLPNWYKIDELIELIRFIGVKRFGYKLETSYPIITVDIPMVDISSSMIRERIFNERSVKYMLPDPVYRYIREYKLYENR
ncbi:nicotinate-nucleotide adenylyltransferase [Oceanobacillus caeni]|uniref:nicotinate-nucleotide adenylyltransferase n=1 Tax=Oceanobacillus caeni TaxID=405946 RepID=UPI00195E6E86|nr:nicotinate-nucleotide adenylyltransferase [Oceanobacillus caeni]MBU8789491.1 nicotinate-nucleotide adenylyltransferase [Oceanobacillus caeni]MCR1833903.1 nicotinate-nucleotide adenylyltransferase [Oceanobacillus caeni]